MGGRATVRPVEMQVVDIVRLDVDGLAGARRPFAAMAMMRRLEGGTKGSTGVWRPRRVRRRHGFESRWGHP